MSFILKTQASSSSSESNDDSNNNSSKRHVVLPTQIKTEPRKMGAKVTPSDKPRAKQKNSRSDQSDSSIDEQDPVPKKSRSYDYRFMYSNICRGCQNTFEYCHERKYSKYCLKAVYSYINNVNEDVDCDEITGVFKRAYNDCRRCDVENRFGYYNPNWLDVPTCMRERSQQEAITMGNNTVMINKLKDNNEEGYRHYKEAVNDHRS